MLWFSSWVVLFSLSLLFVPRLLSRGPFPMLTIIIFLSWDPSHSPYAPFNPYAILCTTTRQGVLFTYLFLVMDDYSSSWFSHICCILLLLIPLSMMFCDLPFLLSGTFYLVLSYSLTYSADLFLSIYCKSIPLYLFFTLDLCNTRVASPLSQVTCSKA